VVAAAAVALVSGVGALSITGVLGRVQRNHGLLFAIAIGLVVAGAALSVYANLIPEQQRTWNPFKRNIGLRRRLLALAVTCTVVGVIVGFGTAVTTADDTETPNVSLSLDEETLDAKASAKVSNLSSTERLAVYVDGLTDPATPGGDYGEANLYQAFVGPDGEGNAVNEVDVRVEAGRFDAIGVPAYIVGRPERCGEYYPQEKRSREEGTGCVIARLPTRPLRPQLTTSWEGEGTSAASLKVDMEVSNAAAGDRHDAVALLRVVAVRTARKKRPFLLHQAIVEPQAGSPTRREFRVPVEKSLRRVCVEARMVVPSTKRPSATCPINYSNRVAVVDLRVPRP
jgi:hypothetical protein